MKARHEKAQAFLSDLAVKRPELPFEPNLLPELFASTTENSVMDMAHIASLVERSQGLAARILRLANSAYYGMQTAVSSLTQAIRLLGLCEVRNIILRLGVVSAVGRMSLPKDFPFEKLWEHQLYTATLTRAVAHTMPLSGAPDQDAVSPDDLYDAGLLHDMGKTMLASLSPAAWAAISALAREENLPFYLAEEEYWGVDHSVSGARLLTFWGLPAKLTELVSWHHVPQLARPGHQVPARILAAANLLAHNVESAVGGLDLTESVDLLLPETLDREKVHESIAASCDVERIRGMAKISRET